MVGGTLWFVAFVAIWPVGGGSRTYSATGNLKRLRNHLLVLRQPEN